MPKKLITPADVLPVAEYLKIRAEQRRRMVGVKKHRRVEVGPFATFYFENYDTMWHQVQEMLYIEKGGAEQVPGELEAYNPLIPQGDSLVATVMFEIDDPDRRKRVLGRLGGVEHTAFVSVAGHTITGMAAEDQDRTNAQGKASSVQFITFTFPPEAIAAFRQPGAQVIVGFKHPEYAHMSMLQEPVRAALAGDFD
ncbi:MAG: DUF3501 family protein [Thalassobaculales bacterium]